MNTWLITARVVHFGSAMFMFGGLAFELFIARPILDVATLPAGARDALHRQLVIGLSWSLAAAVASALVWLVCVAQVMSGQALAQVLNRDTLAVVLRETAFGRLWSLRLPLAVALAALLWGMSRSQPASRERPSAVAAFAVAAMYLASLAWAGHAGARADSQRTIELGADAIHLLAAGAWAGALPGLVLLLGSYPQLDACAHAARRFSTLGMASVGAVVFTGIVNARYLVGDIPALLGTGYGRLLIVKLLLFAAMLSLAAVNRLVLTPRLVPGTPDAPRTLRRNALLEIAAGVGIVLVVAVLGITTPAAHHTPAPTERHAH